MTVVRAIESDPRLAMRYLERKRRDEFGTDEVSTRDERQSYFMGDARMADAIARFEAELKELLRQG